MKFPPSRNFAAFNAQDVGGISSTAAPTANIIWQCDNQAVQVLQGNAIQNVYGGGISCQGQR